MRQQNQFKELEQQAEKDKHIKRFLGHCGSYYSKVVMGVQ